MFIHLYIETCLASKVCSWKTIFKGEKPTTVRGMPVEKLKLSHSRGANVGPPVHVTYMTLWWHRVTKTFLKGSSITVVIIRGSYKCLTSDCQPRRRKQRQTWVGWQAVDRANSRHPEGNVWMQGVLSEDIVSSDHPPPHTNTDIYRGLLTLRWMYPAGSFVHNLSHTLWRRISAAF